MKNILNNIIYYGVVIPLSLLPMPLLYGFSNFLYGVVYKLIGYRKKVVRTNLKNSFPNKSTKEIIEIEQKFYRHFFDLIVETIKTFTISNQELNERFKIENIHLIEQFTNKNKSVVGISTHYGNWEWGGIAFGLQVPSETMGIFRPLNNKFWNKKFQYSRGRFGLTLVPPKNVKYWFTKNANKASMSGFLTDQSPSNVYRCHWMQFLNQETPVFLGVEQFARDYNLPVVVGLISKIKRGYYKVEMQVLCEDPSKLAPFELTEMHTRLLEQTIIKQPEYWLWTHKRWKRTKPKDYTLPKI